MSIARREAKWSSACLRCAGQTSPPVQRATTSPSSRSTAEPQIGALRRQLVRRMQRLPALVERAPLLDHAHDFRDHVAGAPHDHRVADAHVHARDLVGVVQRRVG